MKPYDRITKKQIIKWGTPITLTLLFAGFFLIRPITYYQNEMGYAFCNPTLWFLGLDHLMWEITPDPNSSKDISMAGGLFCSLSGVMHIVLAALAVIKIIPLWQDALD